MRIKSFIVLAGSLFFVVRLMGQNPADYVNLFIGTSNYGTTNPGALYPNGMMSVVPFNVMGSKENRYDKDSRWWSTPYEYNNTYFTGFSHVNLSGVGCPELSSLLLMPTTGKLNVNYREYGSGYRDEKAVPGYYSNTLTKYNIKTEVSATLRTGIARFTFPAGEGNILLNLGEGLTNETGAFMRRVNDQEVEGMKLLGTFCYHSQAVFPIYFVMRVNKKPKEAGYWKLRRDMGIEAQWLQDTGKYKLYTKYDKEIAGDDIGAYFCFNLQEAETIEVQIGVSFVSIANARENLDKEQPGFQFDKIRRKAYEAWNNHLSKILVEGGTEDQRIVFYTAFYHLLIHPNILQDVSGQYPAMESGEILTTKGNRYTVFSLWDTYRNVHQFLTLMFPEKQMEMIHTMLDMYRESGWFPKWELYGRETYTMEGDPAVPVVVDTWMKGFRDFDIHLAYEAMYKSSTLSGAENRMRPDNDDYLAYGYVPLRDKVDNSVSHALEYYLADWNISQLAKVLGKKQEAELFYQRSMGYKHYYSKEDGTFRPILPNDIFYAPFNPLQGLNFESNPGFHEGCAWNYTFYVPHDITGLAKLMGGKKPFVEKLQMVFDKGFYDPTNEPNIAYPYLFSYFKGEEWRTQKEVKRLLQTCFKNEPKGLPGNDDAGTMSAWALFSMMGFYPNCPGKPEYILTTPVFDKVTIRLHPEYYENESVILEAKRQKEGDDYIRSVSIDGKKLTGSFITHAQLTGAKHILFELSDQY